MTGHQCHHRLGDGRLCGSPRQANKNYCYWHTRVHENYVLPGNRHYNPPPLTDLHNITIALSHVWSALSKSMITHKQACAMAYQIQLAKQTIKDILKMEKERKEAGITVESDVILSEDAGPSEGPHDRSSDPGHSDISDTEPPLDESPRYDPEHPPLCMERALRPFNCYREPAPDSTPTWTPISTEEYQQMREYLHMGPGDPTLDIIDLRREMQRYLNTNPDPSPERIAEVLFLAQQDIQSRIKEREDAVRRHQARQRDEQNKKILGLEECL